MPESAAKIHYEFNDFRLDPQQRLLLTRAEGRPIPLSPKVFETLLYFVERRGELLDKVTLMKAIWPNIVVEENSLNQNISALRRALGESPGEHRFIVTEPGRGYRFVADVRTVTVPATAQRAAAPAAAPPTGSASSAVAASTARTSIAVLPFANLTGDPAKEYFSDGMAEELIHTLARLPGLRVPARTSSFAYKGRNIDVREIARDLQVGTLLEGSVRSAGERVRVTAQLIDAESGYHLWSQNYDRKFDDLFELQDALATEIVRALRQTLGGDMTGALPHAPPTRDIEAYHLYLRALEIASPAHVPAAAEHLQRAIARDPSFSRAHNSLAGLRAVALAMGVSLPGSLVDSEKEVLHAIALDPGAGATYAALGVIYAAQGRWLDAQQRFDIAFARDTTDPSVPQEYGLHVAGTVGHLRRWLESGFQTQRLAPAWITALFTISVAYVILGETDEAQRFLDLAMNMGLSKLAPPVSDCFSVILTRNGRFDEASTVMKQALSPAMVAADGERVVEEVYGSMTDPKRRSAAVEKLNAMRGHLGKSDLPEATRRRLIVWYASIGGFTEAFAMLNESLDQMADAGTIGTAWGYIWMPEMLTLRQDARFQDFVKRLKLFDYWQKYGPPDNCELRDGRLICH